MAGNMINFHLKDCIGRNNLETGVQEGAFISDSRIAIKKELAKDNQQL